MLGVQAPKAPAAPAPPADDSWDVAPTRIEEKARPVAPLQATTPVAAAVTPVAPAAVAHVASPPAPAAIASPAPAAPSPGLNASDVRLIVRTLVDDALLPLQRALVEAQQRIAELERRPPPAAPATAALTVMVSATPAPPPAAPLQMVAAPRPYTGAISIPPRIPPTHYSMPPAPLLDVAAIERDIPLGIDVPFNGARRRRRLTIFVVLALLAIFGGLFALLANSYTPHP
jgi:hypothetical protein